MWSLVLIFFVVDLWLAVMIVVYMKCIVVPCNCMGAHSSSCIRRDMVVVVVVVEACSGFRAMEFGVEVDVVEEEDGIPTAAAAATTRREPDGGGGGGGDDIDDDDHVTTGGATATLRKW
jgi:hypothetical protein